jgi:hypothetical protein
MDLGDLDLEMPGEKLFAALLAFCLLLGAGLVGALIRAVIKLVSDFA